MRESGERWVSYLAQLDAGSTELPEAAFDILFSRFGVMFLDDPTVAFAHTRRVLKPGTRVAFVRWRGMAENDRVRLPMGAMKSILQPMTPPDPEAPGPFSFGEHGRVAHILAGAGFTDVAIAPFDASIPLGNGETWDAALGDAVMMIPEVGPLARALADQRGVDHHARNPRGDSSASTLPPVERNGIGHPAIP